MVDPSLKTKAFNLWQLKFYFIARLYLNFNHLLSWTICLLKLQYIKEVLKQMSYAIFYIPLKNDDYLN